MMLSHAIARTAAAALITSLGLCATTQASELPTKPERHLYPNADAMVDASLGVPQFTSVDIASCNGKYFVSWTAVSGATFYQLWGKPGSTSTYYLLGSPSGTSKMVTAPTNSYETIEVQACNGSTCGAFSEPEVLTYYAGCP